MDAVQFRVVVVSTLEQGLLFAFLAFGVLMTFRFFRFPDLTAEGSYPLGGAVVAALLVAGHNPFLATVAAVATGVVSGTATALVHTKLKINAIIAGIITMTATYSIMLRVMGRSNVPLLNVNTVFELVRVPLQAALHRPLVLAERSLANILFLALVVLVISLLFYWFLRTDLGLAVRATGENEAMVRSVGVNTDSTKLIGVAISNGLIALSGALVAQNHGFADIGMGIGVLVAGAAAVLIGESIFGDRTVGTWIVASIVGMFVYRLLTALALRLGLLPTDLKMITALLLLVALTLPRLRARPAA